MDKRTILNTGVIRSELFRTPLGFEKDLGLWVDRIGESVSSEKPEKLRILGLYAAVYIEKGEGYFISGNASAKNVKAGDVMVLYPKIPTRYYPEGEWKSLWVVWGGPEAERLEKTGYLKEVIVHNRAESVKKAYMSLFRIKSREDIESALERKKILIQMILDLYRASKEKTPASQSEVLMVNLIDRISEDPCRDYSIVKLASECNLSPTHFRRLFDKYTGSSPKEFILSMRISRSKQLLSEGKSIKEAAGLSGFNDIFYFMRAFKKMTGITAGRFNRG
ncbi:MAG: AraC family transcriptional regulator [Victivallales bacterium]